MSLLHRRFSEETAIKHLFFRDRPQRNLILVRIYKLLSFSPLRITCRYLVPFGAAISRGNVYMESYNVSNCTCCVHVFPFSHTVLRCRQSLRLLIHHQAKVAGSQEKTREREKGLQAERSFLRYLDTTLRFVRAPCSVIPKQNYTSVPRKVVATLQPSNFDIRAHQSFSNLSMHYRKHSGAFLSEI